MRVSAKTPTRKHDLRFRFIFTSQTPATLRLKQSKQPRRYVLELLNCPVATPVGTGTWVFAGTFGTDPLLMTACVPCCISVSIVPASTEAPPDVANVIAPPLDDGSVITSPTSDVGVEVTTVVTPLTVTDC